MIIEKKDGTKIKVEFDGISVKLAKGELEKLMGQDSDADKLIKLIEKHSETKDLKKQVKSLEEKLKKAEKDYAGLWLKNNTNENELHELRQIKEIFVTLNELMEKVKK